MSGYTAAILIGCCVVAILGVGAAIVVLLRRRARAAAEAASFAGQWARSASAIGMVLDPGAAGSDEPRVMRGQMRGVDVTALWERSAAGQAAVRVEVSASINPPMRFGLQIFRQGSAWHRQVEARFGAQDIEVGIPQLDHPYVIRGIALNSIQAMLRRQESQAFVASLCQQTPGIDHLVNDRQVSLVTERFVGDPQKLYFLVDRCSYLAGAIRDARAWIPLESWEQEIASQWSRVANTLAFRLDAGQLLLRGMHGEMQVSAWIDHHEGSWCTVIQVSFPRPLREHIHLFAQGDLPMLKPLAGLQDATVGSFEFDQQFVVQGLQPSGPAKLLSSQVQAGLLEQKQDALDVVLQSHRLVVYSNRVLSDPSILQQRIESVLSLAHQISAGS